MISKKTMVVREVTMMKIMMMLLVIIVVPIMVILIMTILVIETTLIITYNGFGTENDCVDIVFISGIFSLATPWRFFQGSSRTGFQILYTGWILKTLPVPGDSRVIAHVDG